MSKPFPNRIIANCLLAIALFAAAPASAQTQRAVQVSQLSAAEQAELNRGEAVVTGENGQYVAKVLIPASQAVVWEVMTDYANFPQFLPNVVSCQVLETSGNRKVIEQVDSRQVLGLNVRSRVRAEITETPQSRINFRKVNGDLKTFQGHWEIKRVAAGGGTRVLLTQVVEAQPNPGTPQGVFNKIFKKALGQTLEAVSQEAQRRS